MRLLLWLVLLLLVVLAVRKKFSPQAAEPAARQPGNPPADGVKAEDMVCCARCEVFFPVSEAVYRGDKVYCSVSHADMR